MAIGITEEQQILYPGRGSWNMQTKVSRDGEQGWGKGEWELRLRRETDVSSREKLPIVGRSQIGTSSSRQWEVDGNREIFTRDKACCGLSHPILDRVRRRDSRELAQTQQIRSLCLAQKDGMSHQDESSGPGPREHTAEVERTGRGSKGREQFQFLLHLGTFYFIWFPSQPLCEVGREVVSIIRKEKFTR